MSDIFSESCFNFPYTKYRFPGQASDEIILFITRENKVMLWWRRALVVGLGAVIFLSGLWLSQLLTKVLGLTLLSGITFISLIIACLVIFVGWWWATTLWKKSIGVVTTKRLTKFIYTTPFNRHNLSLPLEMVVDTGSYTKGFLQAIFKLATFTARSGATSSGVATNDTDRINKKYFYLENISLAEDLQHYINKLLDAFRYRRSELKKFRPFIPHLKARERDRFMGKYPQYEEKYKN
jgi:hypothetical protein